MIRGTSLVFTALGADPCGGRSEVLNGETYTFETSGGSLQGRAVLIADNADIGGSFEADSDDLQSVLAGREAEGKGAIASFSPSGLSVNAPAHAYQKPLLVELESGRHARLGDAILAAQSAYVDSGALPELLAIYHLFGDPALRIRPAP